MDQSKGWGPARYAALIIVLAVHTAVVIVLMMTSSTQTYSWSADQPIVIMILPTPNAPKIVPEISRPRRLKADAAPSLTLPVLDLTGPAPPPGASISDGNGPGVDWRAEARRAVHAFEIRTYQPPGTSDSLSGSLSGSPAEEHWWPRLRHHAGEQFKLANGDWVVWLNSSCYQIANAGPRTDMPGALQSPTKCLSEGTTPDGVAATNRDSATR